MKRVVMLSVLCLCLGAAVFAQAQQAVLDPPPVLVITRELLKAGKAGVHEKWEAGWPRAFAKAKSPVRYLAASSLTGEGRVLFMSGYDSFAAWEKENQEIAKNATLTAELETLADKDGDYLKENRTAAFRYLPELSYNMNIPVAGVRYFFIVSQTVKPGHGDHFSAVRKLVREAHEKAKLTDSYAVYQSVAGAGNLYLIFIPMKSLKEMDGFPTVHGKAYQDALGEDGQKKQQEFAAQGLESSEGQIFMFSPKMSYPPDSWIAAEPDFWKPAAPKPAPKKAPAAQ
ncbi:MAG TPA: hypothetical protein VNK82_02980 [Terriglobales bacterium]|nr:hypothetical protein [Terriglobales bacterium]